MAKEVRGRVLVMAEPTKQPDLPKTMKESLQELTKRDMEMMSKRKDANLVKRGKKKAEPKVKNSSAGRTTAKVGEDDHIIMQLRQAQDLNGRMDIQVSKTAKTKLPKAMIDKLLKTHDKLRSNNDKKKFMIMLKHELRKKAGVKSSLKLPDETPPPRSYKPSRSYNDRDAASKLGKGKIRAPGKKDKEDGPSNRYLRK